MSYKKDNQSMDYSIFRSDKVDTNQLSNCQPATNLVKYFPIFRFSIYFSQINKKFSHPIIFKTNKKF